MRLDQETIGDLFRAALLVLGLWGVVSGLWPAIGGISGQMAGAAEAVTVTKDAGVTTAPWDTLEAPSHSWIKVHVASNLEVTVLVVALNSRNIRVANGTSGASADDFLAVAKGTGNDVTVQGGHGGPVIYRISVHVGPAARLANQTDTNLSYELTWEVQKMDPMVIVGGIGLFAMFFITEYLLHMRRDIRALSRKIERLTAEGGVRAPVQALGAPVEAAPEEVAVPEERPSRGGFFGKGKEAKAAPPAAEEIPMPPPSPAAQRFASPAPQPEALGPPAFAPQVSYSPPPSYTPPPQAFAAQPAYQPPPQQMAPAARAPPPPAPAPVAPPPAAPAPGEPEPVSKVRCPQCKHIVPVFTMERPTPIRCPNCGKRGMLTK